MIRVGVCGAAGRMGIEVCRAVAGDDDLQLVAAIDPYATGRLVHDVSGAGPADLAVVATPAEAGELDVLVDFTHADAARANLLWCAEHAVHAVVGTTGFSADDLDRFRAAFTRSNAIIAPNFAIGAVLMMRFAEMAAPYFDTAEIIEFHHDAKIDAPSGTAAATAQRMAVARGDHAWAPDPTQKELYGGSRGGAGPSGIHVHAVRMRGMVAHQEVLLGTTGQTLVIRHDTTDRTSFMPGVVLAAKRVADHPGLALGLDAYL